MRWTNYFIPTVKETPQDAEIPSHQLLLRAGMIRKLGAGLYTFLPLGLRALQKVSEIVRDEMNGAGAIEVLMPAMQPRDLWERSGRYETMTDVMFTLEDKNKRGMVLGPTHEEVITEIAAKDINSYRQLPVNFYQIQTKFRDEIRPRFGLMRAREFMMKDAYSFDIDDEAANASYEKMYLAYRRIFSRCGLASSAVEADSGAIGGSHSHEFMVLAESGEDGIAFCASCGYAANLEKAEASIPSRNDTPDPAALELVDTPDVFKIADVAKFFDRAEADCIKTLIYVAVMDAETETVVAVSLPGDREVNEIKLARVTGAQHLTLANEKTVLDVTGAPIGFAGPIGLKQGTMVIADNRLRGIEGATAGPNTEGKHYTHVNLERDATIDKWADICVVREGDSCPRCQSKVEEKRGIEVGHVFKLGTKYSNALGADVLDENGKARPMVMGCYGIGVTRTLQSAIEQCHDKDGIVWPVSIAPFQVEIVPLDVKDDDVMALVDSVEAALTAEGIDFLTDDRAERPGPKFKDADLIGCPVRLVIGRRGLDKGNVELKVRSEADRRDVPIAEAASSVIACIRELQAAIANDVPEVEGATA